MVLVQAMGRSILDVCMSVNDNIIKLIEKLDSNLKILIFLNSNLKILKFLNSNFKIRITLDSNLKILIFWNSNLKIFETQDSNLKIPNNSTHLTSKSEKCHCDLRDVLHLPQVNGLEDINISNTVFLQSLLENINVFHHFE